MPFALSPEQGLFAATLVAVAALIALGIRNPHLVRIGVRNVPRRRLRTALIIFGLMFATMFVAASLAVDDTITLAVKSVAVFNLGRIDEDVTGHGEGLQLFNTDAVPAVARALASDARVAGVAPALVVPDVLVGDFASRQVRSSVSGLALATTAAGPLADLRTLNGVAAPVTALANNQVYLNRNAGDLLDAHVGDTVYLASLHWPGQRYTFHVSAIVTGGPLGDKPAVVLPLAMLQQMASAPDQINHIYVANAGDGLTGVSYSRSIAHRIDRAVFFDLNVQTVKLDGVNFSLRAQDIFSRILTLYTLFALAIGLLLIFLIFVLLAAERRTELGMTRAIGMRQSHIVFMLLFEGAAYDAAAATLGILAGVGLGALIIAIVSPTIARIGFPLQIALQPQSLLIAGTLGFAFTLITIWFSAWAVSRMTVAAALRDLPEPPPPQPTLASLFGAVFGVAPAQGSRPAAPLSALVRLSGALVARGVIPIIAGLWIFQQALGDANLLFLSVGLSTLITGATLLLRSLILGVAGNLVAQHDVTGDSVMVLARVQRLVDRVTAIVIGASLVLYWGLPFDILRQFGIDRFGGGIEVFFVAGAMMVFGAVLAITPNLDLLLAPARLVLAQMGRLRHVVSIALVYPVNQRLRTGIGLIMFTLVCFTMVVMACIANSATHQYDNLPAQAAGYDIAGRPLDIPIGGITKLQTTLPHGGADLADISSATPLLLGMIEPAAPNARWRLYPAAQIQGAFLNGVGLPLVARAGGFASDAAVWQAVRDHPGDVVIDTGALSHPDAAIIGVKPPAEVGFAQFLAPPIVAGIAGFTSIDVTAPSDANQQYGEALALAQSGPDGLVRLDNIAQGPGTIAPTTLWVSDARGSAPTKLTIVGIVDNSAGQRYGLMGSPATFAPVEQNLTPFGAEYYYFKVKSGVDAHQEAQAIGSALFDQSFETTVLQDVLLDTNGPRVFISRVLVGLVGLTLLVGMAALAVTGSRAVVERRQQIGMLRALGFRRYQVQLVFLIESALIGAVGTALGLVLGLILCRNVFAVDFFAPIQSGIVLIIPWEELGLICLAALLASIGASLLPAWQAGRVVPADALRYE